MQHFSIAPNEIVNSFWKNRYLIKTSIKRDVVGRYRGSFMGLFWSFMNPVLMLTVYTFVFSVIFKARWHGTGDSKFEFALILFSGLLVFNIFSECVNRAPGLILANVNYVKKVIYPLEILPFVNLGSALFHASISFLVWLLAHIFILGVPPVTLVFFPLVLGPLVLFTLGVSWCLAALGVYLRDASQLVGIFTTSLLFLSPVFYSASVLPKEYQLIFLLNPMTIVIEQTRDILFWSKTPDVVTLIIGYFCSCFIAWAGFAWFQKARKGFADVL